MKDINENYMASQARGQQINEREKVLRFRKSERSLHWALAVPFLVCLATALVLVIHYNPDPQRPYRAFFSWTHRISGMFLIFLPFVAVVRSRGDYRVLINNVRQAWVWTIEDLRWLSLIGLAAVSKKFVLPEQGKFNAAEKINFMNLMATYPLYILTGLLLWVTDFAFISWVLHFLMALIVIPLIGGHIYMALINPASRIGLEGMITGFVDRKWAKHHYAKWYREHFGDESVADHEDPTLKGK